MDATTAKESFVAKVIAARGRMRPDWEFAAANDLEFMEAYFTVWSRAMNDDSSLSIRLRELVSVGMVLGRHQGLAQESVIAHMRRAIEHGSNIEELFEVVKVAMIQGGPASFLGGLQALKTLQQDSRGDE